ncbi:MAG: serine/threonine protein kinase [Deferribacteres bacterium]|nr:serine/threonine protein kinase [Deferribacteres bacterium]
MEFGTILQQSTAFIKNKTSSIRTKLRGLLTLRMLSGVSTVLDRQKKILYIAVTAGLFVIAATAFLTTNQIHSARQALISSGKYIIGVFPENEAANWLARARSRRDDWQIEALFKLKAIIQGISKDSGINYALIMDVKNGRIKAHTDERLVGTVYNPVEGDRVLQEGGKFTALRFMDSRGSEYLVDFSSPIYYGQGKNRIKIGSFHFGLPFSEVETALKRRKIALWAVTVSVFFSIIALVVLKDRMEKKRKRLLPESDRNRIGPYVLEKKIASGGMGELFVARKEVGDFRMRVALKRILSEKADDTEYISSLLDEANLVSQLRHPNIATLHDFGNVMGTYFIAMEYIKGENLLSIMKKAGGDMPVGLVLYVVSEVCKGLDYAHKKTDDFSGKPLNIVHRDISPQNILVSFEGDVKIVVGIARAAQRQSKNTVCGVVKGKLHYMSPEQASASGNIDSRSDIFSLGILFYELLSGDRVYRGETSHEILKQACEAEILPIGEKRGDLPGELGRIVMKMLEREPLQRYQTAGEVFKDIIDFVKASPGFRYTRAELAEFMKERFSEDKKDG